jgi:pyruvate formate lyase activating enzyme
MSPLSRSLRDHLALSKPFCVPSRFFIPMASEAVQCITCGHQCVIAPDGYGHCGTRKNISGKLYVGNYGLLSSMVVNPMEKKPFFHYWPGEQSLTIGSFGCNFDCFWCQNYDVSQTFPTASQFPELISPELLVTIAQQKGLQAISFSFNEPTLSIEYALDVLALVNPLSIKSNFVTNGFMSPQVRQALITAKLDAACVNIKGDAFAVQKHCYANIERVWENVIAFARAGVHVELVTLVIPGINDAPEVIEGIAQRICRDLHPSTPWHLTRFHPDWQAPEQGYTTPTPIPTLEVLRQRALGIGLNFVYIGNVPGHSGENT